MVMPLQTTRTGKRRLASALHYDEDTEALFMRSDCECSDDCIFSNNGWCNDGGLESIDDYCIAGTDCTDCGSRDDSDQLLGIQCEKREAAGACEF